MKPLAYFATLALLVTGCQPETESAAAEAETSEVEAEVQYVDAAQAAELLNVGGITIVDVRTPEEFEAGHLADALNIDYKAGDFAGQIAALDPAATYLVHCAVGGRSTAALGAFEVAGLKRVYHLDGGYNGWKAAGLDSEP